MLSPFLRDDVLTSRFRTSAPRRLPARSNDARVRVLGSKKQVGYAAAGQRLAARRRHPSADKAFALASSSISVRVPIRGPSSVKMAKIAVGVDLQGRVVVEVREDLGMHGGHVYGFNRRRRDNRSAMNTAAALSISSFEIRPRWCRRARP